MLLEDCFSENHEFSVPYYLFWSISSFIKIRVIVTSLDLFMYVHACMLPNKFRNLVEVPDRFLKTVFYTRFF